MVNPTAAATEAVSGTAPGTQPQNGSGAVPTGVQSGGRSKKVVIGLLIAVVVVGLLLLVAFFDDVRHWLALHSGTLHGGPDVYYNFWSGFGSDLGEATLVSAVGIGVYTGVRKVNCHTKGCWRIGHHPLDGTPYILCRHHHPEVPTRGASHEHILEHYRKNQQASGSDGRPGPQ